MKKIIIASSVLILLFAAAYFVVSNKDFDLLPNNTNTNNKTSNNQSSQGDGSNKEEKSNNDNKSDSSKILAPDFGLTDLEGNKVTLSQLRGKKVFLNFWASWCPPCREEMPDIEKLYQETKDSDLIILAVNLGEDKNTVSSFLKDNNFNFTVLMDSHEQVSRGYVIRSIPSSYFIDKGGYISSSEIGYMTYDEMKAHVEALD